MSDASLVVIGTSLGGLQALRVLLARLPAEFPVPIAIVQHRLAGSDDLLTRLLQSSAQLPVTEVSDKEALRPGRVYVAPADYHLLVEQGSLALSTEGVVAHARPSVDVLFESAAAAYGAGVIAVVLTGGNADGADGVRAVKARGGRVVVEDPRTALDGSMPAAAIASGSVDAIQPLDRIADTLLAWCAVGTEAASRA